MGVERPAHGVRGSVKVPHVVQKTRRFQIANIRHEILTVRRKGVPQTVTFSAPAHHRTLPLPTTRATKKRIGHNHHHYRHEALRSKKHRTLERGGGRGRSRLPQFLLAATTWRQGRHAIAPRSLYRVHPGWCLMTVAIDQRSGEAFGLFARAETSKRSGVC